jgi:hypothetical protein
MAHPQQHIRTRPRPLLVLVAMLLLLLSAALGQVSKPRVSDEEHKVLSGANNFLETDIVRLPPHPPPSPPSPSSAPLTRCPISMEKHIFRTDASAFEPNPVCPYRLHYMWAADVDSSLYSTARVFDLNGDGIKDVITQVPRSCLSLSRPSSLNPFPVLCSSPRGL